MKKFIVGSLIMGMVFTACSGNGTKKSPETEPSVLLPGYQLVWGDEFDSVAPGTVTIPDASKWWYEKGGGGWGNNELQYYVPGIAEGDTLAYISDGVFHIKAKKLEEPVEGHKYASIRINSTQSWLYGYFEARLKLPEGYGTWPAFWMLPEDFKNWPLDGEIDIMEHAGNAPGTVHITVHTQANNHSKNTQISSVTHVDGAQNDFHVYGLEWTPGFIKGYIDGEHKYTFNNDGNGNPETWPFDKPFYIKLNMALGGFFSDQHTVDETILPAVYEIDYVRVYQKK